MIMIVSARSIAEKFDLDDLAETGPATPMITDSPSLALAAECTIGVHHYW